MIYRFTILSDEADEFLRVIEIDPEATFLDFHDAILDAVNYEKNQLTSFFICNDYWEKEQEVTLIEMESTSEYDNLVMEDTKLEELITDEKQKLIYVFDLMNERAMFIELSEIIPGKSIESASCVKSKGDAPQQMLSFDATVAAPKINVDESFYGDQDFDIDELDEEGFGDMNFDDGALFNDDGKF